MSLAVVASDYVGDQLRSGGLNAGVGGLFVNTYSTNFDGSNEYAQTTGTPSAELGSGITTKFTVAAYFKLGAGSTTVPIMAHWDVANNNAKWILGVLTASGAIRMVLSENGTAADEVIDRGSGYNDSTWRHVAVTTDLSANEVIVYVNGAQVGTVGATTSASLFNSTYNFQLAHYINGAGGDEYGNGNIDEPVVFDVALTSSEITELYNSGSLFDYSTHSQAANLVGWWRMGDGDTHPTLTDQMGFNDLTLQNSEAADFQEDVP